MTLDDIETPANMTDRDRIERSSRKAQADAAHHLHRMRHRGWVLVERVPVAERGRVD